MDFVTFLLLQSSQPLPRIVHLSYPRVSVFQLGIPEGEEFLEVL